MIGTVVVLRLALLGSLSGGPYLVFIPGVIAAGILLGRAGGYVAAVGSSIAALWAFVPPHFSFAGLDNPVELTAFLLSILVNLVITWLIDALRDITVAQERTKVELQTTLASLRVSDSQNSLLLREATHRGLNDYQRLIATLMAQERLTRSSDDAKAALGIARKRIEASLALQSRLGQLTAHGQSQNVGSRELLQGMADDLARTIGLRPITLVVNSEAHALSQKQAVSVGLILNEAVTNCLKYAFLPEQTGIIDIAFRRGEDGYRLTMSDNGVGLAPAAAPKGTGLGSNIIRSLAGQLRGTFGFAVSPSGGTACEIFFPEFEPVG